MIVPARNASATLGETLDSLTSQTFQAWEAVVVDDASTDDTGAVADTRVAADPRIRVISADGRGEGAARNTGLRCADPEWIVFLDSDDMLTAGALKSFADALSNDTSLDVIVGGWARTSPDGVPVSWHHWTRPAAGVFDALSMFNPFPIHACAVRRSLVETVGGFDASLTAGADWDFWQRAARAGAQFGRVEQVVCLYRMRPGSMSLDARALHEHGATIIGRGHAVDPRVPHPAPAYASGRPSGGRPVALLRYACWTAGLAIGAGGDPMPFLPTDTPRGTVDRRRFGPAVAAFALREAVLLRRSLPDGAWSSIWPEVAAPICDFLSAMERIAGVPGLRLRCELLLTPPGSRLPHDANAATVAIELTEPLGPIRTERPRVICVPRVENRSLTLVELAVCDGVLPHHVLADAIGAACFWPLLSMLLERHGVTGPAATRDEIWLAAADATAVAVETSLVSDGEAVVSLAGAPVGRVSSLGESDARALITALDPEVLIAAVRDGVLGRDLAHATLAPTAIDIPIATTEAVGRRVVGAPGTASYRRSAFPRACRIDIEEAAAAAGEQTVGGDGAGIEYAPGVGLERGLAGSVQPPEGDFPFRYDRFAFEALFAAREDPWPSAASDVIQALPAERGRVLEIGCGEGGLTLELATRESHVLGVDISTIALERARERCSGSANVDFCQLDALRELPAGPFDVVVCDGVLAYAEGSVDAAAARVAESVSPSGRLVVVHRDVEPDPASPVFDAAPPTRASGIERALRKRGMTVEARQTGNGYIVQCFRRGGRLRRRRQSIHDARVFTHDAPPPVRTARLPILRFGGGDVEAYMKLLADGGFRTVTFDEWQDAARHERALDGRAVILVFEHEPVVFRERVWPVVRSYGFAAMLLVDVVGRAVDDAVSGVAEEGVTVGPRLSDHAEWDDLVREACSARTALTRITGRPPPFYVRSDGDGDDAARRLLGACGYPYGLTDVAGLASFEDAPSHLPAVPVAPACTLADFVRALVA